MEENPDKILSGIVENCKILNGKVDNMAAVLIFLKKGELKAWFFSLLIPFIHYFLLLIMLIMLLELILLFTTYLLFCYLLLICYFVITLICSLLLLILIMYLKTAIYIIFKSLVKVFWKLDNIIIRVFIDVIANGIINPSAIPL